MPFRTELHLPPSDFKIKHNEMILFLGSCFSQNIGERLQNYKFNSISNPFGTIFHPRPIAKVIKYFCEDKTIDVSNLLLSQSIYVHPDFHSSLGDPDKYVAAKKINNAILSIHQKMGELKYLFITLGTSIGYKQKSTNEFVANCHKLPSDMFEKENGTVFENVHFLTEAFEQLLSLNNQVKIILTVSPVRHIKDGIIENARSKAKLIQISEMLESKFANISYFPAYEWMMDDLRDYRFYEKDLIHPNEQAIDYLWDNFCNHFFDSATLELMQKIEKINRAKNHRPFNPDSADHLMFLRNLQQEIDILKKGYPWIKF